MRAGADPANHRQHAHAAAAPRHRRALCGAAREWQRGGSNCGREAGVATDFIPNTQVPTAETDYVARCEAADTHHIVQQHQLRTQCGRLPVAKRPTRDILANIDSCETRNANCNWIRQRRHSQGVALTRIIISSRVANALERMRRQGQSPPSL